MVLWNFVYVQQPIRMSKLHKNVLINIYWKSKDLVLDILLVKEQTSSIYGNKIQKYILSFWLCQVITHIVELDYRAVYRVQDVCYNGDIMQVTIGAKTYKLGKRVWAVVLKKSSTSKILIVV